MLHGKAVLAVAESHKSTIANVPSTKTKWWEGISLGASPKCNDETGIEDAHQGATPSGTASKVQSRQHCSETVRPSVNNLKIESVSCADLELSNQRNFVSVAVITAHNGPLHGRSGVHCVQHFTIHYWPNRLVAAAPVSSS